MQASHIERRRSEPEFLVDSINSDDRKITIKWQDGHQSIFHT